MSALVLKTQLAIKDAIVALGLTWPATIRAECSRGPMDEDNDANPASNELPAILVEASNAQEIHTESPTAFVDVSIKVQHQADESNVSETVEPQVRELGEWIMGDDFLGNVSSAATSYTALGRRAVSINFARVGRRFEHAFNFQLLATPGGVN